MWAKLSSALKPKQAHDENDSNLHGDVMSGVLEQHPNLSVFHPAPESPPPSPSKSRMGMFKRHTKGYDESSRAPSPMKLLPKKVKSTFGIHGNPSQISVGPSSSSLAPAELSRVSSHDMLSPPAPQAKRRSSFNFLNRPTVDSPAEPARSPAEESHPSDPTTPFEAKSASVRSILRDRNTPGTGQNVRFFSRDAYKVLSPDQSIDTEYQSVMTQPAAATPAPATQQESFLERLQRSGSADSNTSSGSMPRFASTSKSNKSRPTVAEIFSPLGSPEATTAPPAETSTSQLMSELPPLPTPDFTDFFDMSQELDMPIMPPPGLGFEVDMPANDHAETEGEGTKAMTSTPYREKGKGKEREIEIDVAAPTAVDETIFHAKEKAPRLPSALHDRSNSFSFGQTMFYSLAHDDSKRSSASSAIGMGAFPSSAKSSPLFAKDSSSRASSPAPASKGRSRALSDTVFMSMLSPSASPSSKAPEADINDESSSDLVVYSSPTALKPEPDPFSAHATTYYTPATPPEPAAARAHERTGSKEEDRIFALQTQLALQTELCGQFEADLRARDELVSVLGKKLSEVEKEESKRRGALRQWKKKVGELERACRFLEEEVEESRHESMERSVMDEASSEALRTLHRQIAMLERDKEGARRVEEVLREEVGALEGLVREKSEDVMRLKETLWSRDESERELKRGIREAKEQMEMMGNVSIGLIDEEELKKIASAKEEQRSEERERQREAEFGWEEEREELVNAVENAKLENAGLVAELDNFKQQLKDHEEELGALKAELDAQWDHTEKTGEKMEALEAAKQAAESERDAVQAQVADLEEKISTMEGGWDESENKQIGLENHIQEMWDVREALEKEREELTEQLHAQESSADTLKQTLKACEDRIIELGQERQYALDNVARLEDNVRRRDAEAAEVSARTLQREAEAEALREQMSRLKREHAGALEGVEEQARVGKERAGALKDEIERLRRQVHELQQESADKEVKIVQITKQRAQDKQDLQGLNIALDSKQQELELLKRRMGVRGTGGATPAQPSKVAGRRDSAVFNTPGLGSRPPSVLSDAGTDGGSASGAKIPALGKSSRLNNSTSASAAKPASARGSMGPPAPVTKPRVSLVGTPTPTPRFGAQAQDVRGGAKEDARLSRSASARPAGSTPAPAHRRVASATLDQVTAARVGGGKARPSAGEETEKENVDVARPPVRGRVPVPA
ncbi:hypothetical protein DFH07DRAFT_993983 [Mycena maculata]|uniref:Uncharacterized protein n=1 Tax=Mycena maculata TaxID=230809 RepID=A0AAD7MST7_9AGAR|nr:hypothetical protein DFH07DRAFT_993983 [Mycena maculata]